MLFSNQTSYMKPSDSDSFILWFDLKKALSYAGRALFFCEQVTRTVTSAKTCLKCQIQNVKRQFQTGTALQVHHWKTAYDNICIYIYIYIPRGDLGDPTKNTDRPGQCVRTVAGKPPPTASLKRARGETRKLAKTVRLVLKRTVPNKKFRKAPYHFEKFVNPNNQQIETFKNTDFVQKQKLKAANSLNKGCPPTHPHSARRFSKDAPGSTRIPAGIPADPPFGSTFPEGSPRSPRGSFKSFWVNLGCFGMFRVARVGQIVVDRFGSFSLLTNKSYALR